MQESNRASTFLKERHGQEITLIHVIDIMDAVRSEEGLQRIVVITSEIVSPTIELMSKLEIRLTPLENDGTISLAFRPIPPPHQKEEALKIDTTKTTTK